MSGRGLTHRIIKGSMFATSATNGSTNQSSNSITLNRKDLAALKRTDWITFGQPTVYVTEIKDQDTITIPSWLPIDKVMPYWRKPNSTDGKICLVCEETYTHKDKCTNYQFPLEGDKSPTSLKKA